jgi:hypothetical protein
MGNIMLRNTKRYLAVLPAALLLYACAMLARDSLPAWAQGFVLPPGTTVQGHLHAATNITGPPTCTNCSISGGSTDFAGQLSVTSGSVIPNGQVVVTFASAFANVPYCVTSDNTTLEGVTATTAAGPPSTMTIKGGATSDLISWVCLGH